MKTRAITEGALMAAVTLTMALTSYYVPFLFILYMFLPIPTIILAKRQGIGAASVSAVAAVLLLLLFMEPIEALMNGLSILLPGIVLGYCYHKELKNIPRLGYGYLAFMVVMIVELYLLQLISGVSFIDEFVRDLNTSMQQVSQAYQAMGLFTADQLKQFTDQFDLLTKAIKLMFPTVMMLVPLIMDWFTIFISNLVFKRMKLACVPLIPVADWKLNEPFKIFVMIVSLGVMICQMFVKNAGLEIYTVTLTYLIMILFFLMGFSFIAYWTNEKMGKSGMAIRVLVLVVCMFLPFMFYMISTVGVFDVYFGLRKFVKKPS